MRSPITRRLLACMATAVLAGVVSVATMKAQTARASQTASATLSGVVVTTGETPRPIRRAVVTASGGALAAPLSAITDDAGAFHFANLPAGRYYLSASKPAFVPMAYGATRSGQQGTAIALEAGAAVTGITLPLPLGGVVTGTIRDTVGTPLADVAVAAYPVDTRAPASRASSSEDDVYTDDQGTYRIYGLPPGDYVVVLKPRGADGRVEATRALDVDSILRRLEAGQQITTPTGTGNEPESAVTFAPLFYPGTPTATDAVRIRIVPGQVRDGVDMTMDLVPSGTVAGQVSRSDGGPLGNVSVSLDSLGPALPASMSDWRLEDRPSPESPAYRFARVAPGRHVVTARSTVESESGTLSLWAMAEVAVLGGGSVTADLSLRPAVTVSGRVTFAGEATSTATPDTVYVALQHRNAPRTGEVPLASTLFPLPRPAAAENGTFTLPGVPPGTYLPVATAPGWRLESVTLGERDLLDTPFVVGADGADVSGIEVVFSNRPRELTGVLQTPAGTPASGFFVLVFPADPALWLPGARRIRVARPDSAGRYVFDGLPSGDYLLAALTEFDDAALDDAGFLAQVAPLALPVTVTNLPRTTQDIALGGGGEP